MLYSQMLVPLAVCVFYVHQCLRNTFVYYQAVHLYYCMDKIPLVFYTPNIKAMHLCFHGPNIRALFSTIRFHLSLFSENQKNETLVTDLGKSNTIPFVFRSPNAQTTQRSHPDHQSSSYELGLR